ncbi:TGS domain-containing protein, partial [Candidatus Woesearchaeota archaeon]|nr:TGS domain-containing protein [Candidatus Woesearchaeota archaeon]
KFARKVQGENQDIKKALAKQLSGLKVTEENVEACIKKLKLSHKPTEWNDNELKQLSSELRKLKPMIIAANKLDVEGALLNLDKLKKKFPEYKIIGCSSEIELALREAAKKNLIEYVPGDSDFKIKGKLNDKQKKGLDFVKKYLKEYDKSGVQEILNTLVFEMLDYIVVYPGGVNKLEDKNGNVLPDCFLMKNGSTALDFAYRLHTDFGDNFIKAMDVKNKRPVGKDYRLKHRDVIEIMYKK